LSGQFIFSLDTINRNFLKNLISKVIKDKAFWHNMNKLLDKSLSSTKFVGFYFTNDIIE
jgi:putative methionine-R-sulfoxide reductase with GAF domain